MHHHPMPRRRLLPLPHVVAVDVDGTLIVDGRVNVGLVAWLRDQHAKGAQLLLWSMRGEAYARRAAETAGIVCLFAHILSKPGYIVDDKGWTWVRDTKILPILPNGASGIEALQARNAGDATPVWVES